MKNVNCLVDGMWNVAVKKAKRWSGHTSNVCKDETRWDLERVTRVDLLIRWWMVHICSSEQSKLKTTEWWTLSNVIMETMKNAGVVPRLLTMTSIDSPSSRPRPRGSTRRPFGGRKHDFSDSAWQLKKKTWNTYNITNDWTYSYWILNEQRRCWYIYIYKYHNITE